MDGVAAGASPSMRTDLVCAISAFGDLDWSATFQLLSAFFSTEFVPPAPNSVSAKETHICISLAPLLLFFIEFITISHSTHTEAASVLHDEHSNYFLYKRKAALIIRGIRYRAERRFAGFEA